jgi:hypothetical protein
MQGGHSCCFHQVAAVLVSFSPSKVGQFSFECCRLSQRSSLGSTSCTTLGSWPVSSPLLSVFVLFLISAECWQLLWGVGLSPSSLSAFMSLLTSAGAGGSSGRLACHPVPALSLCYFRNMSLRVQLLAPPSRAGSVLYPTSAVNVRLQFTVHVFQFFLWGVQSAQGLHWIIFPGSGGEVGRGVACGV